MTIKVDSIPSPQRPEAESSGLAETKNEGVDTASAEDETQDENPEDSGTSETDEDESTNSDESEDEDSEGKEKPKRKSGYKRRIDKLSSKLSEKEREAEFWRQEALKARKGDDQDLEAKPPRKQASDGTSSRPNPDDFDSHEDYVEAVAEWKAEQKLSERDQEAREKELKTTQSQKVKAHSERVEAFKKEREDYADVIGEALEELGSDFRLSITVEQEILDSDLGPEILYELAKDPEELARICGLTATKAAKEIGKIEARLKAQSSPEKKVELKKTNAPPPISPVGKKATVKKSIYDPNLSQAEYEKIRREQMANRA